jgi:hypothetical protein
MERFMDRRSFLGAAASISPIFANCRTPGLISSALAESGNGAAGPGVSPQHPTWLNGFAARPSWNVAGVDYGVGIHPAVTLKDPTVPANLPSGCYLSGRVLRIAADNVLLDGFDFSKANGIGIYCPSNTRTIIRNCKFAYAVATSPNQNPLILSGSFTVEYCDMDGTNVDVSGFVALINVVGAGGTQLIQYNWIRNSGSDLMALSGGAITVQYNLLENSGIKSPGSRGAHPDYYQSSGGSPNPLIARFNTHFQNSNGGMFSQGWYLANVQYNGASSISNNVFAISPGATPTGKDSNGGLQMHYWVSGIPSAGLASGASVNISQNYCDMNASSSGFAYNRTNATFSGNVNMKSGSSLDSVG